MIVRTGNDIRPLGDETDCSCVVLRNDGTVAVTGYSDGSIQYWDLPTHRALSHRMSAGKSPVECLSFSADNCTLVSCSEHNEVCMWDVNFSTEANSEELRCRMETLTNYWLGERTGSDHELGQLMHVEWLKVAAEMQAVRP